MFEQLYQKAFTIARHKTALMPSNTNVFGALWKARLSAHTSQTIRAWLGHVSLDTTNICAEVDLEMKSKVLARLEISGTTRKHAPWHSAGLMEFLKAL